MLLVRDCWYFSSRLNAKWYNKLLNINKNKQNRSLELGTKMFYFFAADLKQNKTKLFEFKKEHAVVATYWWNSAVRFYFYD